MEPILGIFLFTCNLVFLVSSIVFLNKIRKLERAADNVNKEFPKLFTAIIEDAIERDAKNYANHDTISNKLDRYFLEIREHLIPIRPMRANNWDSMKQAFRPPKMDKDE